jgi:hypothetical protein
MRAPGRRSVPEPSGRAPAREAPVGSRTRGVRPGWVVRAVGGGRGGPASGGSELESPPLSQGALAELLAIPQCKSHIFIIDYFLQCVAVDACAEPDLVDALKVSGFPEILFTNAGRIIHREKGWLYESP